MKRVKPGAVVKASNPKEARIIYRIIQHNDYPYSKVLDSMFDIIKYPVYITVNNSSKRTQLLADTKDEYYVLSDLHYGHLPATDGEQKEQGIKHSSNKVPMSILLKQFPNALQAVALSGLYGHKKYEEHDEDYLNYKRVGGEDTYLDAGLRHQLLCKPEQEESGLPPKFHVAWNALADLEIFLENNEIDVSKVAELNIPIWENEFKT